MKHVLKIWKNDEGSWNWHVESRGRIICGGTQGYRRRAAMYRMFSHLFPIAYEVAKELLDRDGEMRF